MQSMDRKTGVRAPGHLETHLVGRPFTLAVLQSEDEKPVAQLKQTVRGSSERERAPRFMAGQRRVLIGGNSGTRFDWTRTATGFLPGWVRSTTVL